MAAEVLSFQQEEGKTAYYATFVSDGNSRYHTDKEQGRICDRFRRN